MTPEQVIERLQQAYPDGFVDVTDMTGNHDHYSVYVASPIFQGMSRILRHKHVMAVFDEELKSGELHALTIRTDDKVETTQGESMSTKERIEQLLNENQIVLFMKGYPNAPQCGFSARATAILAELGAEFKPVNVLEDMEIREGIKEYGQWPTIPQLYINKELIGGSDIMMEMFESGELKELIK